MTRVFLAAGVAALAIVAPAQADPHGGGKAQQNQVARQGGGPRAQAVQRGRAAFAAPRMQRQAFAAPQMRTERQQVRPQRMQVQAQARMAQQQQIRANRAHAEARIAQQQQIRVNRQQAQARMAQQQQLRANRQHAQARTAEQQQLRTNRQQAQTRMAQQQQLRANREHAQARMAQQQRQQTQARMAQQQQARANRQQAQARMAERQLKAQRQQEQAQIAQRQQFRANQIQAQNRMAARQQLQANRQVAAQNLMAQRQQLRAERQLATQNLLAQRQALTADRIANANAFRASRLAALTAAPAVTVKTRVIAPVEAVRFVGQPVSMVTNYVPLTVLPASVSYLYPPTPAYYYEYGGGYLYQVDRGTSLIDALIPLLAGGFMPGTYLPQPYMSSYVPAYYGLDSFYPASYNYGYDYGYGYGNVCNRYAYGVVYQVDCVTGMVEDVIPLYAGGYGVGQMLPSAYSYYNVPMQYRSLYYPTADYSYWYAPGAIYQYDPSTSLITSVAALMSPGFTVGQPLPMGYDVYNVPYAYRATYYDTPAAWYRYNNGYIYQVDPSTMLVTAIVASLLT